MTTTETKQNWYEVLTALCDANALPSRVLLWGPPGVGKSSWAVQVLGSTGRPYRRIAVTEGMQPDELLGTWTLRADEHGGTATVWVDGPVVEMMRAGGTVVLDEIDAHGSGLSSLLHAVLDDPTIIQITLPNGDVVRPAQGYRVICTSNESPGALPTPIVDRLTGGLVLLCDAPHPGALELLPNKAAAFIHTYYARDDKAPQQWVAPVSVRSVRALYALAVPLGLDAAASLVYGAAGVDVLASIATTSVEG